MKTETEYKNWIIIFVATLAASGVLTILLKAASALLRTVSIISSVSWNGSIF
jgi:hypothetical protein